MILREEKMNKNNYSFEERFKGCLPLAHNELGTSKKRALRIMKEVETDPDSITGMGLSWGETKALSAVQRLLDKTNYLGDVQTKKEKCQLGSFKLPVLFVKITDYLTAYELERNSRNRFNSNQREEALKNLESLENHRKIFFEKSYWQPARGNKKGEWISNFVEIKAQLIAVKKLYSLPSQLAKNANDTQKRKRYQYLQIICSPVFFYRINEQYLLKPKGLFRAIENASHKSNNKAKKSTYNLILLLLQTDLQEISYFRDTLIQVLELNGYLQRRQQKIIDKSIQEAIYIATELGFLLSSNYDSQSDKFTFKPNPKLCSRLERKLPPTKEPPDLSSIIDEQMEWQLLHSFMF